MAMLTLTEAAKICGFKYITLYGWVQKNKIPHYNINGSYRIDEEDLKKFLESKKVVAK
jgi:excisionase family DNA binding protein